MIRIETTIFCDICGDWLSAPVASIEKRGDVRRLAKEAGWKRKRGRRGWMIDLCPRCLILNPEKLEGAAKQQNGK